MTDPIRLDLYVDSDPEPRLLNTDDFSPEQIEATRVAAEAILAAMPAGTDLSTVEARLAAIESNGDVIATAVQNIDIDGDVIAQAIADLIAEVADELTPDDIVGVVSALNAIKTAVELVAGTWDYKGGEGGTVNIPAGGRVLSAAAIATSPGATVAINGGDEIPVPERIGWEMAPRGNLVAPEIVFTGTASYTVEYVT